MLHPIFCGISQSRGQLLKKERYTCKEYSPSYRLPDSSGKKELAHNNGSKIQNVNAHRFSHLEMSFPPIDLAVKSEVFSGAI